MLPPEQAFIKQALQQTFSFLNSGPYALPQISILTYFECVPARRQAQVSSHPEEAQSERTPDTKPTELLQGRAPLPATGTLPPSTSPPPPPPTSYGVSTVFRNRRATTEGIYFHLLG